VTNLDDIGIGYTLATGRLFCELSDFHKYAEDLLQHPILTHEFADRKTWDKLREAFEIRVKTSRDE
jgi:hypothetical protein